MFLGIQILVLILISPFVIWLFSYGIKNKENLIGKVVLSFYALFTFLILSLIIYGFLSQKMTLDKSDYYGDYIINRNYFKGKQADWQYNHFRFTITKKDSMYFYLTNNNKVEKIFKGKITTVNPYDYSERLVINMEQPTHHILSTNPTTYRKAWSFILVFKSPKFNNMYFKKGKWKPLKEDK